MNYESKIMQHKTRVSIIMTKIAREMIARGKSHDNSKFKSPEREIYSENLPKLENAKFGSEEYNNLVNGELAVAVQHHYRQNDHHPEHFEDGFFGMNLIQIMEMVSDWVAVSAEKGTDVVEMLPTLMREKDIPENYYMILKNTLEYVRGM